MSIEAMKQALEALEKSNRFVWHYVDNKSTARIAEQCDEAIKSLRQAIAAEESSVAQEHVAWDCCANCGRPEHEHKDGQCPKPFTTVWHAWDYDFPPDTHPQPKAEQKPLDNKCPDKGRTEYVCSNRNQCWEPCGELGKSEEHTKIYEQAPKREWVGLTDDDIRPLCKEPWVFDTVKQWTKIIEAKLKEKNAQTNAPLTQQEVVDGFCKLPHEVQFVAVFDAGVRFAEAAHSIKGKA